MPEEKTVIVVRIEFYGLEWLLAMDVFIEEQLNPGSMSAENAKIYTVICHADANRKTGTVTNRIGNVCHGVGENR